MNDKPVILFARLFKEAYKKYFDRKLTKPISEAECKLLSNEIEEKTGFVLGYKSIKNYSIYITGEKGKRQENPSLATLDTLARYVFEAPESTELERKKNEDHYPYWHLYQRTVRSKTPANSKLTLTLFISGAVFILTFIYVFYHKLQVNTAFHDDFNDVSIQSLESGSWSVVNKDAIFWEKRGEDKGFLNLFTLKGDNWPDTSHTPVHIKNMLIRPVAAACFEVEVLIKKFLPKERWQQAGIILLEDSIFTGKMLRLSIAYNDFFGGFDEPAEIIIQGITSSGNGNPEEILHIRLFQLDAPEHLIRDNLKFCRLRIEKKGIEFRFLIAIGTTINAAYKEIGRHVFNIKPNYVGIFALKGNVNESSVQKVKFDSFTWDIIPCK